jgi:hypothetical protein
VSVVKTERYRAKCDGCGALGDLRDSEAFAVQYAIEKQNAAFVVEADGVERLLCVACQAARGFMEQLDRETKGKIAHSALREMAAKAAVLDGLVGKLNHLHEMDGGRSLEPYTASHLSTVIAERIAEERAKRGLT